MRPIDADTIEKDLETQISILEENSDDGNSEIAVLLSAAYKFCLRKFRSCPTLQVSAKRAERSGKWLYGGDSGYYQVSLMCSECGYKAKNATTYCPNCGVVME